MLSFQEQPGESWGCVGTWPQGAGSRQALLHWAALPSTHHSPLPPRLVPCGAHKSALGGGGGGWVAVEREFSQCHSACPDPLSKADTSEHGPAPAELPELAASSQLPAAA